MNVRFTPNPAFEEEMAHDAVNHEKMKELAQVALDAAAAATTSRQFQERLAIEDGETGPELVVRWSLWHLIEYGSVNNAPEAPLRRGLEAAGLVLTDGGHA